MRTPILLSGFAVLLATVPILSAQSSSTRPHTPDDIRKSVVRALPYIETEGVEWMKERKCMSCHVVPFMVWSFSEASTSGVEVDQKKLAEWTIWCAADSLQKRTWFKLSEPDPKVKGHPLPEGLQAKLKPILGKSFVTEQEFLGELSKNLNHEQLKEYQAMLLKRAALPPTGGQNDGGSIESIAQLVLGRFDRYGPKIMPADDDKKSMKLRLDLLVSSLEFEQAAPDVIFKWQEANGSWKAGGQLPAQNRPRNESTEVTTAWTLLALGIFDGPDAKTASVSIPRTLAIERGLKFFRQSKPGKSHESLLMHMLIEKRFGRPGEADEFLKTVLARQNADGGWSWLVGGKSDAFATGQTLYALTLAGLKPSAGPIQRGQKYLLDTQSKEGIWEVPPQAISDTKAEGRLRRLVPIYHFWGSTWAVIGLSRSLGE